MNNRHINRLIAFLCCIYNFCLETAYRLKVSKGKKKKIRNNRRWKGTHEGESCFIFGTGPSVKEVDFSLFADEFVISVNQLYKNENFPKLKSDIHVWADSLFFKENVADDVAADIKKELYSRGTEVFYPLYVWNVLADKELLEKANVYNPTLHFHEYSKRKIDLTGCMVDYGTVIFQCIQIAVYMGFKNIYLLGCDCTGIQSVISRSLNEEVKSYGYTVNAGSAKMIGNLMERSDMQSCFQGWANIFKQYKYMNSYLRKQGINLYNLTEPTILDSVERKSICDVLKKEK